MLEAGTQKPVTITWTPPAGYDVCFSMLTPSFVCVVDCNVHVFALQPNIPMETSVNVTLRGDIVEVYRVMLKGFVVTE